jgi:hypothetical protein
MRRTFAATLIRSLLADRFHLTIHRETKEVQGDTLVASKNGPKIRRATAVHEQLGLKLESGKVPAEVIVLDHVERPTPD